MLEEFIDWYLEISPKVATANQLLNLFIEYLLDKEFRIIRSNMGTRTLHPQVETVSYLWAPREIKSMLETQPDPLSHSLKVDTFARGYLQQNRFKLGSISSTQFAQSPIYHVLSNKTEYYFSFANHIGDDFPFPILKELTQYSPTGYFATPIEYSGHSFAFFSLLTNKLGGFSAEEQIFLKKALNIVAVKWISFLQADLTESLLNIYLGKSTGSLVHSGKIYRGDLEKINSFIWFSDIRNYSGISEKLSPEDTIELLNAYFGSVIPIIEANGGEVLKMLGDGVLAVFPYGLKKKRRVGLKVLIAVRDAARELRRLNEERSITDKLKIQHAVGIHLGEVMYGNIGSPDRLDFTVIGEAVNLTSRISGMCGELNKTVLASEDFAREIAVHWEPLGKHKLKGIAMPRQIFGLPEQIEERNLEQKVKS
jgi:adenylate cyclase